MSIVKLYAGKGNVRLTAKNIFSVVGITFIDFIYDCLCLE